MNGEPSSGAKKVAGLERERVALSLLLRAGRRAAPPPEATRRVYESLLDVWTEEVHKRPRFRWRSAAVATLAAVVVACAFGLLRDHRMSAVSVASVTRLQPGVTVTRSGAVQSLYSAFELQTGDRIDVPSGASLAAQRPDGLSVRIAGPANLRWDGPQRIQLERGRVYVDLGPRPDPHGAAFEVRTPFARIEHVGTRFVAQSDPTRVRVAVRDGQVRITSMQGTALGIGRGQAAEAAANGQLNWVAAPTRTEWEWVDALAPPCGIEGRSLFDVLTDLAREAGLELAFASSTVERRARSLTLHGPALDLPPRTAIDAVLSATDLDADLADQRVILRERLTTQS